LKIIAGKKFQKKNRSSSHRLLISSPKAQAKMAQFFVEVFGERLLTEPLKNHPCEENYPLPSPNDLKDKILIKNKKLSNNQNTKTILQKAGTISATTSSGQSIDMNTDPTTTTNSSDESKRKIIERISSAASCLPENSRHAFVYEDEDISDDDDKPVPIEVQTITRESQPTKVMSDLVIYIVPVRFKTFARAEERNRSFEMSSFSEDKAYNLIRDHAKEFLAYNQRQLSRIYPRGTRFESSNYNPYIFWPIGCQMAALNYQTLGKKKKINHFFNCQFYFRYSNAT
jgi:phosphatidylinositol phospholipase C beta